MPLPDFHPTSVKDGRRILSEKSANACLSPVSSPIKRTLNDSSSPKKLLPSPLFTAHKRPFHQVDDENSTTGGSLPVQQTARLPGTSSLQHARLGVAQEKNPNAMDTAEQTEQQNTLNTHQPPIEAQISSQAQIQASPSAPEEPTNQPRSVPEDPQTRKLFIQEKATLLRSRIQNAMRHVRDPQFDRRVSELEAYSRKYPRLSGYTLSQKQQQQQQQQQTPVITHTEEEEEEEEEEEQEDNDDNDEAHDTLLTPRQPPTITPAQNQSQAEDPEEDQEEDQEDPLKTPTQKSHRRNNTESSTHAYIALAGSPMQLSSPPSAAVPETGQRGDAVDGLLKLMNTAEKGRGSEWMI